MLRLDMGGEEKQRISPEGYGVTDDECQCFKRPCDGPKHAQ